MTLPVEQVLHIDLISITPGAEYGRDAILEGAAELSEMPCVMEIGAIEAEQGSDFNLAVYFVLPSFTELEPFGTDQRYVRFLQGTVAPNLRAFGGASVRLEQPLPAMARYAACLAVEAPAEAYDWEVSEQLARWAESTSDAVTIGLAIGERQRYRGIALAFAGQPHSQRPAIEGFDVTFLAGRLRRLR